MIFCVGVEPHIASYSCLQNNCNMMNNKLNCETIFATLYFLHPSKCLQALLMVPYLDSVYIFIAQNLTQAYTIQDMQDTVSVFLCVTCVAAGTLGSLSSICASFVLCLNQRNWIIVFFVPWWWHICNPRGPPIYIHMRENLFRFHPLV